MKQTVTWKIGGEAGFGIMSAGTIFAKSFTRSGYDVFVTNEYPSLIRGGHNVITVKISTDKIHSLNKHLDILIALNKETVSFHINELSDDTLVVFDPNDYEWTKEEAGGKGIFLKVPLTELTKQFGGSPVMRNTVAIGASMALIGADFQKLAQVLESIFKRKGEQVVKENVQVAKAGYDYITSNFRSVTSAHIETTTKKEDLLVINGSEALGLAAVRSGLKFAAIYPMTPINALITYLADHAKKYKLVYKQPEDEIAGINMAIGASVAGARSLVATSGGGFALMVEGLALSGMIETPIVIDIGMRVGPATGMPTWTEQGELRMVIHAGHGEFPRVVFAPGDAEEIFDTTVAAFNISDKYQIPVFILSDKYLNESQWCVPASYYTKEVIIDRGKLVNQTDLEKNLPFKRYLKNVGDGVSPRSIPGMKNGFFVANSYEHDEFGLVTDDPINRNEMVEKRMKKMSVLSNDIWDPKEFGDNDAEIVFVSWGSNKGVILEAMRLLSEKGIKSKYIHYIWMYPFPKDATKRLLLNGKRLVLVEQNATAQLGSLISEFTGIEIKEKLLKYDGRPFFPEEIVEKLKV